MSRDSRFVNVLIDRPDGTVVFKKDNFEVPKGWSDRAATIMASKYATDEEFSAYDIIQRVVDQITEWGITQGYFNETVLTNNGIDQDEEIDLEASVSFKKSLCDILLDQRAAFNSPVWFNCGTKNKQQMSACFIVPVEDTMESILRHNEVEGMIFRSGSGAGCNVSPLRGKGEKLSNKGTASGPISFMKMWDATAGVIKSGGKTRRSAKMICMDVRHPDIMEFIRCKAAEEVKAKTLIASGISEEEAYATVAFQNTNHSVVVTDDFMNAYLAATEGQGDTGWYLKNIGNGDSKPISPRRILCEIAEIAWQTGDPGLIFGDRVNKDNPIPSMGRINSPNPCSEFFAVDNSSCNLASLNLLKYLNDADSFYNSDFNWSLFKSDIHILITAMDILVDAAEYPTPEIREITTTTRPLGLGFSNLGALLMLLGFPYDSEEGRDFAALVAKEMTYNAYMRSTELARRKGPFKTYPENRGVNLELVKRLTNISESDDLLNMIKKFGIRNSQVTLLAPTGTISFMMDCDSTGIEPLFALKSYKQLAGGGVLEIEPECVKIAKEEYGDEIKNLFDTANEISWKGHIDMMAACQKYLNGAISKTVNLPSDCTDLDIRKAYIYAWEKGLKALAVYRDGSKGMQPLVTAKPQESKAMAGDMDSDMYSESEEKWAAVRRKLPETTPSIRHKFNIAGFEGYLHCGVYEDGSLGELFIVAEKMGSTMQGILDAFATSISLGLQYGVPLEKLIQKFSGTRFEPAGFTHCQDIPMANSVIDYIFRWLELQFIEKEDDDEDISEEKYSIPPPARISFDGPPCPHCHSITGKVGTCYLCSHCGTTTGCS